MYLTFCRLRAEEKIYLEEVGKKGWLGKRLSDYRTSKTQKEADRKTRKEKEILNRAARKALKRTRTSNLEMQPNAITSAPYSIAAHLMTPTQETIGEESSSSRRQFGNSTLAEQKTDPRSQENENLQVKSYGGTGEQQELYKTALMERILLIYLLPRMRKYVCVEP